MLEKQVDVFYEIFWLRIHRNADALNIVKVDNLNKKRKSFLICRP